jgi:hypothetical protein
LETGQAAELLLVLMASRLALVCLTALAAVLDHLLGLLDRAATAQSAAEAEAVAQVRNKTLEQVEQAAVVA